MEPIKGMSLDEIDPYNEEKKSLYLKMGETILVSSFNYLNDFAKFMIGLNSALLTAYFAILKIADVKLTIVIAAPFFLQLITIALYLVAIFPRTYKRDTDSKPLIFTPEKIISVYQKSIDQKKNWAKRGSFLFFLYLISMVIASITIIGI